MELHDGSHLHTRSMKRVKKGASGPFPLCRPSFWSLLLRSIGLVPTKATELRTKTGCHMLLQLAIHQHYWSTNGPNQSDTNALLYGRKPDESSIPAASLPALAMSQARTARLGCSEANSTIVCCLCWIVLQCYMYYDVDLASYGRDLGQ
eukprot:1113069-Amphidinium_carterae.2